MRNWQQCPSVICVALTITLPALVVSAHPKIPPAVLIQHENHQPERSYALTTDDPRSIQAYYREVGVGPLILPTRMEWEDMRETCWALGDCWRPLGHLLIPGSRNGRSFPLGLCYREFPMGKHAQKRSYYA